jgi:hypothetical protein
MHVQKHSGKRHWAQRVDPLKIRARWLARVEAKRAQRPISELRALARELGIKARSRMGRAELEAALRYARASSAIDSYSSGRTDVSVNHDKYLEDAYSQ